MIGRYCEMRNESWMSWNTTWMSYIIGSGFMSSFKIYNYVVLFSSKQYNKIFFKDFQAVRSNNVCLLGLAWTSPRSSHLCTPSSQQRQFCNVSAGGESYTSVLSWRTGSPNTQVNKGKSDPAWLLYQRLVNKQRRIRNITKVHFFLAVPRTPF